jgi:hypothetical protein
MRPFGMRFEIKFESDWLKNTEFCTADRADALKWWMTIRRIRIATDWWNKSSKDGRAFNFSHLPTYVSVKTLEANSFIFHFHVRFAQTMREGDGGVIANQINSLVLEPVGSTHLQQSPPADTKRSKFYPPYIFTYYLPKMNINITHS